jgi:hypothetical protein
MSQANGAASQVDKKRFRFVTVASVTRPHDHRKRKSSILHTTNAGDVTGKNSSAHSSVDSRLAISDA